MRKFAQSQVDALLRRLAAEVTRTADSPDPDAVHDLRVAIRRLKRALRTFAQFFPAAARKRVRRELTDLMDAAAKTRDHDIALELLEKAEMGPRARVVLDMQARRLRAGIDLQNRARFWLGRNSCGQLRDAPHSGNAATAPWDARLTAKANARRFLPRMLSDYFAEVRRALAAEPSPAHLHPIRLASKKIRYTVELFRPCYAAGPFDAHMQAMKDVQTSLGEVNDAVAARKLLSKAMPHSPRRRKLRKFLKSRAAEKAKEFRSHWTGQFDAPGQELWWRHLLEGRNGNEHSAIPLGRASGDETR